MDKEAAIKYMLDTGKIRLEEWPEDTYIYYEYDIRRADRSISGFNQKA